MNDYFPMGQCLLPLLHVPLWLPLSLGQNSRWDLLKVGGSPRSSHIPLCVSYVPVDKALLHSLLATIL